jgi:hypothetical protein
MSASAMQMQVHPYIRVATSRCEALRAQLASLLAQQATLLEHTVPQLEALYLKCLGQLEFTLFEAEVANACLRRRLELLRAILNRGEALTPARRLDIEGQIRTEQFEWEEQLRADERKIEEALRRLSAPTLPPEDAQALKSLYRRLVRQLHPDVTGGETGNYRRYWNEVQEAYRNGDLDYLEVLAEAIERTDVPAGTSSAPALIEAAEEEVRRLENLVQNQIERLAALRSRPPLCYEPQLRDPEWVAGKKQELADAIRQEEALHRTLLDELRLIEGESSATCIGRRASPRAIIH